MSSFESFMAMVEERNEKKTAIVVDSKRSWKVGLTEIENETTADGKMNRVTLTPTYKVLLTGWATSGPKQPGPPRQADSIWTVLGYLN